MKSLLLPLLACFALLLANSARAELATPDRPRELLLASTGFADRRWDEATGLVWSPLAGEEKLHRTRESTWYALGLLERDGPGDTARALRIVEQILGFQYATPGQRWDGTFRRFLEEPRPAADARLWKDYDPNWRHFIGTTFVLMLERHAAKVPAELQLRLLDAIRRAVEGELTQGRAEPYHTNIRLMHGFLWSWAGARLGRADWIAGGERWLHEVAAAFGQHETFEEYNSPTYYGVDFYGLALARRYGATEKIRTVGAQLEAALWRDVARFYHADLRNLAGPYDRSYGMDMRRYVSLTGVWMGLALPAELTPLPDPTGPMGHAHDFLATPLYVALGAQIPADVAPAFLSFQGERQLRRTITSARVATAWIARDVMIGGEITGGTFRADPSANQFHPATIHWRGAKNDVAWLKLHAAPALDAEAAKGTLTLTAPAAGEWIFHVRAPGAPVENFSPTHWQLPGLSLLVESNPGAALTVVRSDEFFTVTFTGVSRLVFRVAAPKSQP